MGLWSFEIGSSCGENGLLLLGLHWLRLQLLELTGLLGEDLMLLLLLLPEDWRELDVVLVVILTVDHGGVLWDKVSAVGGSRNRNSITLLLRVHVLLGLLLLYGRRRLLALTLDRCELGLDLGGLLSLSIELRLLVIKVNKTLLLVNSALNFLKLTSILVSCQVSVEIVANLLRLVVDRVVITTHVVLFQVRGTRQRIREDHPVLDLLTNILIDQTFHLRRMVQFIVVVVVIFVRLLETSSTAADLR